MVDLPSPRTLLHRATRALARVPWLSRAVRTTVAAVLAWVLVGLVPGPWSDYPYYAPLGAVVATSVSVRGSTRRSAQAVLAIALGAVVARLTDLLPLPSLAGLAVVVLVGVLLSGWRAVGDQASWVPTSALFVLVIGNADPVGYVSAYIGLTLFGALVGVGINLLLPPLPLTPADRALDSLRDAVADHLGDLAESLRDAEQPVPSADRLRSARAAAHAAVADARDAARANWSARRYREWRAGQDVETEALDAAARVARDSRRVVQGLRALDADDPAATGGAAARAGADALEAAAAVVRSLGPAGHEGADPDAVTGLTDAERALQEAIAADRNRVGGATRPADALVVTLAPLVAGSVPIAHVRPDGTGDAAGAGPTGDEDGAGDEDEAGDEGDAGDEDGALRADGPGDPRDPEDADAEPGTDVDPGPRADGGR